MVEKVIIVSVHVLYFSFTPIYVGQEGLLGTQVYASLRQFTSVGRDVELDKIAALVTNVKKLSLSIDKQQAQALQMKYSDQ